MFPYNANSNGPDRLDRPGYVNHAMLLNQAITLFNQARWNSAVEKVKHIFHGGTHALLNLESIPANMIRARCYGGIKPTNLDDICGTLGRAEDFDQHFHPLDDRIRDRWVSIATARSQNIPLEPVELIQIRNFYFVKDGHHRISVARALDETAIDAEVTIWDVCGAFPWEEQPAARIILSPIS